MLAQQPEGFWARFSPREAASSGGNACLDSDQAFDLVQIGQLNIVVKKKSPQNRHLTILQPTSGDTHGNVEISKSASVVLLFLGFTSTFNSQYDFTL